MRSSHSTFESVLLRLSLYSFMACLLGLTAPSTHAQEKAAIHIDADFPGGNILVNRIENDTVTLGPGQRDSVLTWFYWYYRVRGASGRTLTFVLGKDNVGVRGPAVSMDTGKTWKWLGAEAVTEGTFAFTARTNSA